MRSLLFVPGDSERKLDKALAAGADTLIIDLEDSVSPAAKGTARGLAADFMGARRKDARCRLFVRINDLSSGLADDDLASVMTAAPDGIMLPKAVGAADVTYLAAKLRVCEAECGIADGATRIVAIVTETPAALFALPSFAGQREQRLAGLTWGAEDLSAALGARATRCEDGRYADVFRLARSLTLVAAAAAETDAIDTVFVDFRDGDGLLEECREAERDGFTGKMAIHPDQVAIINAAFAPSAEAVSEAEAVVAAFRAAGDAGVVGIGGRMFDRPHLRRAERLLARALGSQTSEGPE